MPLDKRELQKLHDRSVLGPEYQRRIHELDPDLTIAWNRLEDRYEVWREEWDERRQAVLQQIIARGPVGKARIDIAAVIHDLRLRDTQVAGNSHVKQMDRYLRDLEREEKEKDDRMFEAIRPVHERLAWQVARDTGHSKKFVGYTPPPKVG